MISTAALSLLLTWLLSATVKGSLLIFLVVALNAALGRFMDARWRHLLWVVVLVRLMLPVAPSSPLSLFNLMPAEEPLISAAAPARQAHITMPATGDTTTATVVRVAASPVILFAQWAAAIWLLGALVLLARTLFATLRTRSAVAASLRRSRPNEMLERLLDESRRRLGIRKRIRIVESSAVRTPALHGIFNPVLLLPAGLTDSFSTQELRYVILHELWHLRRMDVAVNWALSLVQALHWFNPLVWFAASRIREERELACDELALSCLEDDERLGYGATILKLLQSFQTAAPVPALVGIVNGKHKMKRRLTMIASFRNRTRFSVLLLVVVAAVGAAALTDAKAGEQRILIRHAGDPAALASLETLGKRVNLSVTNATFGELLNAVASNGIAVSQSPELATLPIQQARFSITAVNVPLHAVLMEALMPFELHAKPTAEGVSIEKGGARPFMIVKGDGPIHHEARSESVAGGKKRVEMRVMVVGPEADAKRHLEEVQLRKHAEELPPGAVEHKVMIDARAEGKASTFDENGKLHRELKLQLTENGVASEGKLTIDIQK